MTNYISKFKNFGLLLTTLLICSLFLTTALSVQAGGVTYLTVTVSEGGTVDVSMQKKGEWQVIDTVADTKTIKISGNINELRLELIPDSESVPPFHVSSVKQDNSYISLGDPRLTEDTDPNSENYYYEFVLTEKQHTFEVGFSSTDEATVPQGQGVSVLLSPVVGLTFTNSLGGVVTGEQELNFPDGTSLIIWRIDYAANAFTGEVQIALHYDEPNPPIDETKLKLICGDSLYALYSDVDGDLDVDGTDVSIVANVVNTNNNGQTDDLYVPELDINNDQAVDKFDLEIVNDNKGASIQDITTYPVDTDLNIIYGITSHFSIFRCR
jgi:hypothetical protein